MYIEPVAVNVISIHAILTTDEIPLIPSQAYSWDDHPLLCRPHFSPWGPPCVLTIYTVRTLHSCRWALGRGKEGCLLSERYSIFFHGFEWEVYLPDIISHPPIPAVFSQIDEYAPGFSSSVVGYDALAPPDLERIFGLTGGLWHW